MPTPAVSISPSAVPTTRLYLRAKPFVSTISNANEASENAVLSGGALIGVVVGAVILLLLCCFAYLTFAAHCRPEQKPGSEFPDICLRFQVKGHTNVSTQNTPEEAKVLSLQRATAVRNALIMEGVKPGILAAPIGCGNDHPIIIDGYSKEAFKNLRVEIQVTNLEDLASALAHIQLRHPSWDPKQGFDICSSPDIMVDVSNGILNHKRILCKTHAAEFAVPEAEAVASIQAIARVLVLLESHAERVRSDPTFCTGAKPVSIENTQRALDIEIGCRKYTEEV